MHTQTTSTLICIQKIYNFTVSKDNIDTTFHLITRNEAVRQIQQTNVEFAELTTNVTSLSITEHNTAITIDVVCIIHSQHVYITSALLWLARERALNLQKISLKQSSEVK